jgi:hypothetical protein
MTKQVIQQRKRIFITGEGESEQSFIKWLQLLSDQQGLHIHLDFKNLEGGGYKTMLEKAVRERKRKERYKAKSSILLVDSDRSDRGDDGWSLLQLKQYALKEHFEVCVQHPNLEGLLWRMLPNNEQLQPSSTKAHSQLCQSWPDYQKPADTRTLAGKFSSGDLFRVAKVDSELNALLLIIGLQTSIRK